ncbi:hypothetical protein ACWC5O_29460, partial [Streptomyces sp. NPDC001450]
MVPHVTVRGNGGVGTGFPLAKSTRARGAVHILVPCQRTGAVPEFPGSAGGEERGVRKVHAVRGVSFVA